MRLGDIHREKEKRDRPPRDFLSFACLRKLSLSESRAAMRAADIAERAIIAGTVKMRVYLACHVEWSAAPRDAEFLKLDYFYSL